jgi:hypothetical protein
MRKNPVITISPEKRESHVITGSTHIYSRQSLSSQEEKCLFGPVAPIRRLTGREGRHWMDDARAFPARSGSVHQKMKEKAQDFLPRQ